MSDYGTKRSYGQYLDNQMYDQINGTSNYQNVAADRAMLNARIAFTGGKQAVKKAIYKNKLTLKRKGFLNKGIYPEKKNWDTAIYNTPIDSAGIGVTLCEPPQDTSDSGRIGRKVTVKSIQHRIWFSLGTTQVANAAYYPVRIIIYIDKQPNGAFNSLTDLLEFQGNTNASDAMKRCLSPLKLANSDRFQVLKDMVYEVDAGHGYGQHVQHYKKVSFNTTWTGTAGGVANIESNALNMIVLSANYSGGTATNSPIFNHYTRVRYIDT